MSYPMNEFITDVKRPVQMAEDLISSTASAARTACHEAGNEISSLLKRGEDITKSVRKRVAKEACAVNAALHSNPYPTVLAGIGAGALLGFLVAWSLKGRSA